MTIMIRRLIKICLLSLLFPMSAFAQGFANGNGYDNGLSQSAGTSGAMFNVLNNGVKGDGSTDDTTAIQNVLNICSASNLTCYFPAKTYAYSSQIVVPSNTYMYLQPGVIFKMTTLGTNQPAWLIQNVSNVYIWGYGSLWTRTTKPTQDQQRHNIRINGGVNIHLWGIKSEKSGGDGFTVSPYYLNSDDTAETPPTDIYIIDCWADNNRRNGMSITSSLNVYIKNFKSTNTTGNSPQAGIDIEPATNPTNSDILQNLNLTNIYTANNSGTGINISMNVVGETTTNSNNPSIRITNALDYQSNNGFEVQGTPLPTTSSVIGQLILDNLISVEAKTQGIFIRDYSSILPRVILRNPMVLRPNANNSGSALSGSGIVVARDGSTKPTDSGNALITNPIVVDDRASTQMQYGFYVEDTAQGLPMANVSITGNVTYQGGIGAINSDHTANINVSNGSNVGVGIINPTSTFQVVGTGAFSGNVQGGSLSTNGGAANSYLNSGGGNVGVGSANPGALLDLSGGSLRINGEGNGVIFQDGTTQTTAASTSFANPTATVGTSAVNGSASTSMRSDAAPAISQSMSPTMTGNWAFTPSSGNTLFTAGNIGVGSAVPGQKLDVQGTVRTTGFNMPTGAGNGKVFTSDSSGNATWSTSSSGVTSVSTDSTLTGGPITTTGTLGINLTTANTWTGQQIFNTANVGIGSANPGKVLDVQGTVRAQNLIASTVAASKVVVTDSNQQLTAATNLQDLAYCQSSGTNCPAGGTNPWLTTNAAGNVGISTTSSVGIGTTSGSAQFVVMSGNVGIGSWNPKALFWIKQNGTSATNGLEFIDNSNSINGALYSDGSRVRLDAVSGGGISLNGAGGLGNVGIGTTKLGTAGFTVMTGNVGLGTWVPTGQLEVGTRQFNVVNGNVGIGSVNPGTALDIVGGVRSSLFSAGQGACWCTDGRLGYDTAIVALTGAATCNYNGSSC